MKAQVLQAKRWKKELRRRKKRAAIARAKHEAYLWKLKHRQVVPKPVKAEKPADKPKPKTSLLGRTKSAVKQFLRRTP